MKSPQLRTKDIRVIRDRHAHEQRRAAGAEAPVFDRKRRGLSRLGHGGRSPPVPFVGANAFRCREQQAVRRLRLIQYLRPNSHGRAVELKIHRDGQENRDAQPQPPSAESFHAAQCGDACARLPERSKPAALERFGAWPRVSACLSYLRRIDSLWRGAGG